MKPSFFELEKNIIINFIRGTGKGGQNKNKVSSACQIIDNNDYSKYIPGYDKRKIIIFCDVGRSQELNKIEALKRWRQKVEKFFYKKPERTINKKIEKKIKVKKDRVRLDGKLKVKEKKEIRKGIENG